MYGALLFAVLTTFTVCDLTNSHAVQPLVARNEAPPVIPKVMWEVGVVPNMIVYIEATKIVKQGDLVLMADDGDDIVFACRVMNFRYARKVTPTEPRKKP